jgi:hypothetical protein
MTPNEFYSQHVTAEAPRIDTVTFRPFWSVRERTRLDRLMADGSISLREWLAAIRFRDAVRFLTGERRGYTGGGAAQPRTVTIFRFDAAALVRRVRADLGPVATALAWSCAVDDRSWAAVGARFNIDPKTARRWTVTALQALAMLEGREAREHERPHNPDPAGYAGTADHRIR